MNYNETSQWAADLGSGYSAIRPLGEGGMGTLYRAHKDSLDVDVVIKRVKQKFKGRMDERAEANILKTLKHKYLPRIYDVIESPSGYVYTIMDMIPGENMQNYVKTHGPVSQKLAYRWACQLCEVIAYLHSQVPPILHCDIKPSNIMITPAGDICVIDFNTSLVFSKGVLAIGATPGYAAPEQYTRPGASPDTIETVPLEETMPLRGYKDAFAYQNVRSNKDIIISTAIGSYGSVKEQYPLLNARLAVEKAIKLSNEKAKGQTGDDLPFEPSGEHQYRIFYDALTWEEAKAACEAKGGHLATITSEEEQQKLNLYNAGNHKLWIGGYKNTEGQWCWVTGEPWEYENWGDGEPNNSSNVVAGESCVAMWPEKWNDLANSNVYEQSGYICEWEASDVAEETQVEGYTGHLYEFYTLPESEWESGPITWQQAERRCEWKGGHLAVIESSTENFLLYSAMKAKGYENAYFGYSDKSSEGNWKWVNGTSTAYTNWHSGEPNNQDGIEHYAMFYENFQDGTWNDADGIIDAGCAYICEWDDPTDKISQGDSFTDQQLRIIAKDLGVPDDLNVEIRQSPKAYWESAGLWDIYVEITHNGKLVASGSFDVETGEMGRNIYIYTPV